MDVIFHKYLKISLCRFFRETFLKIGVMILLVSAISLIIISLIPSEGLLAFLFKTIIFLLIYSVGFFFVSNEDEKNLILRPIIYIKRNNS